MGVRFQTENASEEGEFQGFRLLLFVTELLTEIGFNLKSNHELNQIIFLITYADLKWKYSLRIVNITLLYKSRRIQESGEKSELGQRIERKFKN